MNILVLLSLELEQYLWGVVPAEMPALWPEQALRAQAVLARAARLAAFRAKARTGKVTLADLVDVVSALVGE